MRRRWVVLGAVLIAGAFFAVGFGANAFVGRGGIDAGNCEAAIAYYKVRADTYSNLNSNASSDTRQYFVQLVSDSDAAMKAACLP